MNIQSIVRVAGWALMLSPAVSPASAEDLTNAIQAFLQQRVEVKKRDVGLVIGLVGEQGRRVVSCGRLDSGTRQPFDGDTLFEVGSITKACFLHVGGCQRSYASALWRWPVSR